jgi:hypothetical protein
MTRPNALYSGLLQLAERAHLLSSDSVISLGKLHSGDEGRLHVVVNLGSGLLGV